ncbi:MAG TPA: protein kinase [Streptosporangiaceae bacterium]|nr:protein kinase [Streptosporangiaceae bacterium]
MHAVMGNGRVIGGRYRLLEPIGRGAMGIVWRGRDQLLARDVAVKEIQVTAQASAADAELIYQRTLREARTAARLSHPSVVKVFDVVEEDGTPWIVMELVDARSLDRVITEQGPLPPAEAAELGSCLVSALATAHSCGVLHRDVKPSNVLVTPDGRAILTDFGIATFAEDLRLTQAGMVVGTPGFTAPERIRGDVATPASDLWSLGATLYAAVEGRGPFERVGGSSVISAGVASEDAPRAPSAGPLAPVIDALLSRDPVTRPDAATAAQLLAEAATAARTGPRPLRDGWPGAEADREAAGSTQDVPAAAGRMTAGDSGFLDPPDYEALQIPSGSAMPAAADRSLGSDEVALAPAAALAGAVAVVPVARSATPAPAGSAGSAPSEPVPPEPHPATASADESAPGGLVDPNVGPVLWGPVRSGGSTQPGGPAGGGQGGAGTGGYGGGGDGEDGTSSPGLAGEPRPAGRSSGRWRLMVAATGIAALGVAALVAWNVFQHSGTASALGSSVPAGATGTTSGPGGSGSQAASGTRSGSSGSAGSGSSNPHAGPTGSNQGAGSPKPGASGAKPSASPSSGSSPSGSPHPSPSGSSHPSPSPSPTTSSPSAPILPAGYQWHKFSAAAMGAVAGFEIGLPDPWTQSVSPPIAQLVQSARSFHLAVDLNYWQYAAPLREAEYLQTQAAAAHKGHGYLELLLSAINFQAVGGFRSAAAAELKYSWNSASLGYNVTELVVLVTLNTASGSQPYEFALSAPTSTFSAARGILSTAMPTFRPLPS